MVDELALSEADVSRLVRDVEARSGILALRVHGVSPWQLVRFEVSLALQRLSPRKHSAVRATIAKRLCKGLMQVAKGVGRAEYVCKTFDSALRVFDNGKYRDIYFDDILAGSPGGVKISSFDATGYDDILAKAKLPPVFDDTSIIALSAIMGRLLPFCRHHEVFERIAEIVRVELGLYSFSAARVSKVFNVFWWRVHFYRMLLKKMGTRSVWVADSGQFALMRAADQLHIPFTEIQHGVCTNIHPNVLPDDVAHNARDGLLLPSRFAVYGEHSKSALSGTLLAREGRIQAVGASYIDAARAIREREWRPDAPIVLTVTAQGVATEQLGSFIGDFLGCCTKELVVNIKLHPAYNGDETYYRSKFSSDRRVKIMNGQSDVGTHRLIALSHMHLSISSTCHYDALGIGTPTCILALETHESVLDIQSNEGVVVVRTAEELANVVAHRNFPAVPERVRDHFFQRNYVANMVQMISS